MIFLSPAKVNLFFKILRKKNDGYHEIASLYQAVSLFDKISIELSKKDSYNSNVDIPWQNNLIKKAIDLFKDKTKIDAKLDIYLEKNIPIQAGLGGGSSNAATTLFALNEIFLRPLSLNDLIEISKKIGSDIAFFFSSGTAYCTDTGTSFQDIQLKKQLNFLIAKPTFGMPTKDVFENVDITKIEKKDPKSSLEKAVNGELNFFNDLEISAFELNNQLRKIKNSFLDMGFDQVVMTGSGSSFMLFGDLNIKKTENISIYKVFSIQKKENSWYSLS